MWHRPEFAGGGWDGSPAAAAAAAGTGVEFGGVTAVDGVYNQNPAAVYGCTFTGTPGTGTYVGGYDGYYGMYNLPSLSAASPWSTAHAPSLGYNAVGRQVDLENTWNKVTTIEVPP